MQKWRSHKTVEAFKITNVDPEYGSYVLFGEGEREVVDQQWISVRTPFGKTVEDLGYFIRYSDGYTSWSPTKAFEEGYSPIADEVPGPPAPDMSDVDLRYKALEMAVLLVRTMDVSSDDAQEISQSAAENFYKFLKG